MGKGFVAAGKTRMKPATPRAWVRFVENVMTICTAWQFRKHLQWLLADSQNPRARYFLIRLAPWISTGLLLGNHGHMDAPEGLSQMWGAQS